MTTQAQNKTIHILEAPAGRGKTHKYLIPRLVREKGIKFTVCVPTIALQDEIEQAIWNSGFRVVLALNNQDTRVSVTQQIKQLQDIDPEINIHIVTHAQLHLLPPTYFADRVLIIDEMPSFLEWGFERKESWEALFSLNHIKMDGEFVRVTETGTARAKLTGREGEFGGEHRKLLRSLMAKPARKASNGWFMTEMPPTVFRLAREVVVMAADLTAGYFPEWIHVNGFELSVIDAAQHGIELRPHCCKNTEIYYLDACNRPTSQKRLDNQGTIRQIVSVIKRAQDKRRASLLRHPETIDTTYLCAMNKDQDRRRLLGRRVPSDRILSPTVRGLNRFSGSNAVLYLASLLPNPNELRALHEIYANVRSTQAIAASRHQEALYQFVLRSALRVSEDTPVKVLVVTKGDADALAEKLNPKLVEPITTDARSGHGETA